MPRPRAAAKASLARNVASIRAATVPEGVFARATAPSLLANPPSIPSPASGGGFGWGPKKERREALSATEIFLIGHVVLDQHAAVDGQRHAGDHACGRPGQEQDRVGDVL